jgi:fibronectin-binding autotransporter adhesin
MIRLSFKPLSLGLLTLACMAAASTASAGTITTWSGTAANNNWSTNGNWTTKPTTSGTFSLVYRGAPTRATSTNDIGPGAVSVDSILFNNTGSGTFTSQFILSRSSTSPALSLVNGATVTTTAVTTGTLSDSISSSLVFGGTATFNMGSRHNLTLSGTLSGGGSLVKQGAGDLLLTNTNSLTALSIEQGVVQVNTTAIAGITGLTVDIGSSGTTGTFRTTGVGSAGTPYETNMKFNLNGDANITPNGSSNITFNAANFNQAVASVTTPVTLTLDGGGGSAKGTETINGLIQDNSASGKVNVTIGTATSLNVWVLNGVNTYTGDTTIQAGGKLLMNGTISGSSTTTSYGYLGGSGTFGGAVIISSGTLAPGGSSAGGEILDAVGDLTMASLSLSGSATTQLSITGSTSALYDQLIGSSTLNYGGTLALTMADTTSYNNGTFFNLFTGFTGSPTGDLSGITLNAVGTDYAGLTFRSYDSMTVDEQNFLAARFGLTAGDWYSSFNSNQQALVFSQSTGTLTVVPEPSTCAMALAGLAYGGWQMMRRRRLRQPPTLAA